MDRETDKERIRLFLFHTLGLETQEALELINEIFLEITEKELNGR